MALGFSFPASPAIRDRAEQDNLPEWFDRRLRGELLRKRNRPRGACSIIDAAAFWMMGMLVRNASWRFSREYDWSELESYIEDDCREIRASDFQPDVVVGIKSGGAFIANLVGTLLGTSDVGYVRVERYSPVWGSTVLALLTKYFRAPKLVVDTDLDLTGRKVLLVDDQVLTGKSLSLARQWVESCGASEIRTYCVFTQGYRPDYGTRSGIMMKSPWGDDP